jgi:hypothetical protein
MDFQNLINYFLSNIPEAFISKKKSHKQNGLYNYTLNSMVSCDHNTY